MLTVSELRLAVKRLSLQIAIDGPAGAGKSTVGQGLAGDLDCLYVDTGLMYRAVTWRALQSHVSVGDADTMTVLAEGVHFSIVSETLVIDGEPPELVLHSPAVDAAVSTASTHPTLRRILVDRQRSFAAGRPIVMVGRDIGSIVLPDAPVKIWVTASPAERARRRHAQRSEDHASVATRLLERDSLDSTRAVSPSLPASDATILDTELLSPTVALAAAMRVVEQAVDARLSCRAPETKK